MQSVWVMLLLGLIAGCIVVWLFVRRLHHHSSEIEERTAWFSDLLPVGVFQTDSDGRCTFASDLACRLAGLDRGDVLGLGWMDALHPDDRDRVAAEWAAATAAGTTFHTEYRFGRDPGPIIWVQAEVRPRHDREGRLVGFVGVIVDVTARKKIELELESSHAMLEERVARRTESLLHANDDLSREIAIRERVEQALLESERRLRAIVEHAPCWIFIKDLEGRYLFTSTPGIGSDSELGRRFAPGLTDRDLFSEEIADALRIDDARIVEGGVPMNFDETVDMGDGPRDMFSVKFPLRDEQGRIYALGGISTDVTDNRRLAAELARRRDELAHVLRLHSMGEVVSEIAHEVNQPLSAIVNYAGGAIARLRAGELEPEAVLAVLERISEQGHRGARLLHRVRGFVRSESYAVDAVDVNQLVRDACIIVGATEKVPPRFRFDLDSGLPAVQGEAVQLEQVIVNLLRNGLDAMQGDDRPELLICTRRSGDAVELLVCDQGVGIDAGDDAKRIFEPFFSTKEGGLGMGLSISRNIVEAHGGTIAFERNIDRGTTFRVVVPVQGLADQLAARARLIRRPSAA